MQCGGIDLSPRRSTAVPSQASLRSPAPCRNRFDARCANARAWFSRTDADDEARPVLLSLFIGETGFNAIEGLVLYVYAR